MEAKPTLPPAAAPVSSLAAPLLVQPQRAYLAQVGLHALLDCGFASSCLVSHGATTAHAAASEE